MVGGQAYNKHTEYNKQTPNPWLEAVKPCLQEMQ